MGGVGCPGPPEHAEHTHPGGLDWINKVPPRVTGSPEQRGCTHLRQWGHWREPPLRMGREQTPQGQGLGPGFGHCPDSRRRRRRGRRRERRLPTLEKKRAPVRKKSTRREEKTEIEEGEGGVVKKVWEGGLRLVRGVPRSPATSTLRFAACPASMGFGGRRRGEDRRLEKIVGW